MKKTGVAKGDIGGSKGQIKYAERRAKKFLTSNQPDAYTRLNQDRTTYYTTWDLAKLLKDWMLEYGHDGTLPYPVRILKWCKLWFGELPDERLHGKSRGYRIPLDYLYVARAWTQTENVQVRKVSERVLLADPKPWIVVVDDIGSTHYTNDDVLDRVGSILPVIQSKHGVVSVINVGPMEEIESEFDSGLEASRSETEYWQRQGQEGSCSTGCCGVRRCDSASH